MPTIRIDDDVYSWLKAQAEPFEDTPNSVLRRIAGLGERSGVEVPEVKLATETQAPGPQPRVGHESSRRPNSGSGKEMARRYGLTVSQARYNWEGNFFMPLTAFPGVLFDPAGYVLLQSADEYASSPYLRVGRSRLHVPGGIAAMPNYKRLPTGIVR